MAKTSSLVFGIIFIIAGVWGFVSSPILGIFAADTMSSIIHIIVGIVLLAMASKPKAVVTLKTVGVIYIIFAIIGFISGSSMLGIFTVNSGANWLYIVLGIVIAVVGWSKKPDEGFSVPSAPQM
ncbi:MAG: DUF4383 domain-containing protein [Candidatus Paceibacterota bacterium]